MNKLQYYDDLGKILNILPPNIIRHLSDSKLDDLIEIVLDLGRRPEMRFSDGKIEYIGEETVNETELEHITQRIEDFTNDNRSGVPGTLHRISAIRNRKGKVIGLTCRIGRVVTGTIVCISDLVKEGKSILFLGRPGVGKTTKLREISRMMADEIAKRVVVVDTSNEIAGDGDVPHMAIGNARRMQVPSPEKQKDIMIEAVENHTPQVIVVDEIGTEEEAQAARTIAERGVMLIATAHGNALENLIKNPTLSDLVGGVNSVTLSDDEARRRSTQKTVLEREKSPTFDIVIEIIDRDTLAVYPDAAQAVDYILRDWPVQPEIRKVSQLPKSSKDETVEEVKPVLKTVEKENSMNRDFNIGKYVKNVKDFRKVYIYAISRSIVDKAIERLELNAEVTRNIDEADIVLSHKSYSKGGAKILSVAEDYRLPVHYVKSNSMPQIQKALKMALDIKPEEGSSYTDETEEALDEAQKAVKKFLKYGKSVELKPRSSKIRKLQHEYIEQHELNSKSKGEGSERHLEIVNNSDVKDVG